MGENTANHLSEEELVSKIYKDIIQLDSKKKKKKINCLNNGQKTLIQTYLHRSYEDGQQTTDVKKCSSPVIREIQVKTTERYHLTPVRIPIVKKTKKEQVLARIWIKENTCALLVGLYITAFIMENSMDKS